MSTDIDFYYDENDFDDYEDDGHGWDCDCPDCTEEFYADQCGLLPDHLGGGCQLAGTEQCDFDCPIRRMRDE